MDLKPMELARSGPLAVARFIIGLFSDSTAKRSPPLNNNNIAATTKTQHVRLVTIATSHFCEKVRWGLDLLEADPDSPIYYTEDGHAPPFHSFETLLVGDGVASVTPAVVCDNGRTMARSSEILLELCPFLYPAEIKAQILEVEQELGNRLGATVRRYNNHLLLQPDYYKVAATYFMLNCPKVEQILFAAMLDKGIDKGMREAMNITDETALQALEEIRIVFKEVSDRLQGEYLMDTTTKSYGFTAADVTFCALTYPILRPDCMANFTLPDPEKFPPELNQLSKELRDTKAGQYALRIYKKHRPKDPTDHRVHVRSSGRQDRFPWKETITAAAVAVTAVILPVAWVRMKK